MVRRLRSALASLVFLKEEEARYTARFVTYLLPACMVLGLLLIIFPLTAGNLAQRAEALGPVLVAWAAAWSMLRRGKVRLASLIFVFGTWVMATYAAVTRDGVRAPAYMTYLVLVTYAAFLVTPGASLGVFVISLLAGLGMVAAAAMGVLPTPTVIHTPTTLYASYSASMVMVVAIILMITAEYRDAFGRLRASEEQFRLCFTSARDPIFLLDQEGHFVNGNGAAIEALGLTSRERLVGRTPADFSAELQPDGVPSVNKAAQLIQAALAQGSTQFEWTHRRADGSEMISDIALTVIPMKPALLVAHLRDITERKRAQAALARRTELDELILAASTRLINLDPGEVSGEVDHTLRELGEYAGADRAYVFEYTEDGTMSCTQEWCREGVSPQIHRLQGLRRDDFPWHTRRLAEREVIVIPRVRDLPPEAQAEREEFERASIASLIVVPMVLAEEVVGFIGFDCVRSEEAWTEEIARLLRSAANAVSSVLARGRAQEALAESEERFRLLFEAARDPIVLMDTEGRAVDGNEAAVGAFGLLSRAEATGHMVSEFSAEFQPDGTPSEAKAERLIRAALEGGSTQSEWACRRKDGSEFVADVSLTAVRMKPAPVLMAHVRDVTERKAAQAALTRRIELEELIIAASTRLINLDPGQVNREIDSVLEELGEFAGADRAYVFQLREDGTTVENTHEWVREGVSAQRHMFEMTPVAGFPWLAAGLMRGEVVLVPRVKDLPPEAAAERKEFERQSVESVICVPMLLREQAVGFIGFDSVTAEDVWTEETATLLRTAANAITSALVRTRAQEALRESEERFRSLVEATSDWIWEVDTKGAYTYASPKVKELLGYEPEEVLGRTPFDMMPPEEAARVAKVVRPCFERGEPFSHLENTNRHKDGHAVVLDTSSVPVLDDAGALRGFRGIDRDITEEKQAQEALRESEARYRRFLQMAVEGIWRFAVDPPIPTDLEEHEQAELILERTRVAECNDVLARRYGFARPEDMIGARVDDLWVAEHEVKVAAVLQIIRSGYRVANLETTGRYTDGSRAWFLNGIAGIVEEGHVVGAWATHLDITRRKEAEEALRREHDFVSRLAETSPVGITALNREGEITFANAAAEKVLGLSRDEATGRTYNAPDWRITNYDGGPFPDEELPFVRVKSSGKVVYGVHHAIERSDGQRVLLSINAAPIFTERGEFDGMVAALEDVTERRRAEEALRQSEERFRAIVESTRDWIWFCDSAGVHRYSNRAIEDLLGHAVEEIVGESIMGFMHPEDVPLARAHMEQAIAQRGGWASLVIRWRHKDGTYRYLESTAAPAFGPDGALLGWYGADRDITERVRMQEALQRSEARLRALFAAMTDLILVLDAQGRYLEIAPTKPDLLYRPAEEVLGKTVWEVFPAEQAEFFMTYITQALETGRTVQMEYSLLIRDKVLRFAALVSPLSEDTVIIVARDVTPVVEERERALAAERARADLAEHLNEEINHRARNNLAMVSGLLQTQALQEPDPRVSSRLREAIARIRTFVDIHEKIYAVGVERVDLLEVTRQVASTLCALYSEVGAECTVEGAPGLFPTRSATNLAVIANELVTNALKYGGPDREGRTRVEIRLTREEGKLRIAVWNSGNPVPEGFDAAAQRGMGLRLVASMVAQSGGTFGIRPQEGGSLAEVVIDEAVLEAYG